MVCPFTNCHNLNCQIKSIKIKMHAENTTKSLFTINTGDENFKNRRNNVFAQLDSAELNRNPLKETVDMEIETTEKPSSIRQYRGKESIFKKPEVPIARCLPVRRVPDFRKNPHKWTKYTLGDVRAEDMSERSNTAAALTFLKELETRKESNDKEDKLAELPSKITFKKHVMLEKKIENTEEDAKETFRSSKVIMPEYVVGQKLKKDKKNKEKRAMSIGKQLKLDHLLEDEDEN